MSGGVHDVRLSCSWDPRDGWTVRLYKEGSWSMEFTDRRMSMALRHAYRYMAIREQKEGIGKAPQRRKLLGGFDA